MDNKGLRNHFLANSLFWQYTHRKKLRNRWNHRPPTRRACLKPEKWNGQFSLLYKRSLEKLKPTRLRRRLAGRRGRNLEASGEETTLVASWSSSFDSPALCLGGMGGQEIQSQTLFTSFLLQFSSPYMLVQKVILFKIRKGHDLTAVYWTRDE